MQLLVRRENTSFYESFSDLIFCTLVLFIVLVMILSLSVNEQVEAYAEEQQEIKQKLIEQKEILKDKREELLKLEDQTSKERQKLRDLLGETRFSAHFGETNFHMACDLISQPPRYWPIPASFFQKLNTKLLGESEQGKKSRLRELRKTVLEITEKNRSYSAKELGMIVKSFSYYNTGKSNKGRKTIGISTQHTNDGIRILNVFPHSAAEKAGLKKDDVITHIQEISLKQNGMQILVSEISKTGSGETVKLDVVSPNNKSREIVCGTDSNLMLSSVTARTYGAFDFLASGLIDINGKVKDMLEIKQNIKLKRPNSRFNSTQEEVLELITEVKNSLEVYSEVAKDVDASQFQPSHIGTLPEINIHVSPYDESGLVAGIRLKADEILQLTRAIGGRGAVLNWIVPDNGPTPEWVKKKVLEPSGFMEKVPRL